MCFLESLNFNIPNHVWFTVTRKFPVNSNGRIERLMCNFHYLGYYCSPNLSIHQNSTQEPTWNFLVTLHNMLIKGCEWVSREIVLPIPKPKGYLYIGSKDWWKSINKVSVFIRSTRFLSVVTKIYKGFNTLSNIMK